MKAAVYSEYGPAEVLRLAEVEKPEPRDNQVLIKVHAATVTTGDSNVRGFTFVPGGFKVMARMMFGWNRPKQPILGVDIGGVVEAVGKDVTRFKPGDAVFGTSGSELGAYAEYACRAADGPLLLKPEKLSYEDAVSLPFGAGTALLFLRDRAKVQPGQKVLVIGAAGGVGVFAVQLARYYGAEVTGVCSTGKLELVKSLGADKVIDYTQEDFLKNGQTYDVIVDTVPGKHTFAQVQGSLAEKGAYAPVAGGVDTLFQAMWSSLLGGKKVIAGPAFPGSEDLAFLAGLAEAGKIRAVIDKCYPLDEIVEAHRRVDSGHKTGSVVISVAQG